MDFIKIVLWFETVGIMSFSIMGHHKGTSVYGKSFTSPMKSPGPKVNRNYLDDVNNV